MFFYLRMVIETLKKVTEARKCFRLVGGVLTERKVKDVLPVLMSNGEKLEDLIQKLNEQLEKKGIEINDYKEKHSIRVQGQGDHREENNTLPSESRGNVLVS